MLAVLFVVRIIFAKSIRLRSFWTNSRDAQSETRIVCSPLRVNWGLVVIILVYESGTVYDPAILDISDDDLRAKFLQVCAIPSRQFRNSGKKIMEQFTFLATCSWLIHSRLVSKDSENLEISNLDLSVENHLVNAISSEYCSFRFQVEHADLIFDSTKLFNYRDFSHPCSLDFKMQ